MPCFAACHACYLDSEVEALQQRKAVYDEERRLSEGSDSCWSGAYSDSDSAAELEVNTEPIALEGAVVVVIQGGEGEGATGEQAGKRKRYSTFFLFKCLHSELLKSVNYFDLLNRVSLFSDQP